NGIYHDKTLVYDDQIRVIEPLFCEQTDILLRQNLSARAWKTGIQTKIHAGTWI
ncbi:hypothetical protein SEEHN189_17972, partial [Salmonella enterica subsp. enterica serovar Heidelberg str. N189]